MFRIPIKVLLKEGDSSRIWPLLSPLLSALLSPVLIALAVLTMSAQSAQATEHLRANNPWPIIIADDTLSLPFWGGFNTPKPFLVDFDKDGLTDLMIGDGVERVSYFRNTGNTSAPVWTPVEKRLGGIGTGTWFTMCDIDDDGDEDLFCDDGIGTTAFYRNDSNGDEIIFTLVTNRYFNFPTARDITPAFADIDADGDFDFFIGNSVGFLTLYRNWGTPQTAIFIWETDSYDDIRAYPTIRAAEPMHGLSAITFSDMDSDGDLDLYYGDLFNFNLYYFINLGTPQNSNLKLMSQTYLPFQTRGFNHVTTADLDGDGDRDMIIGAANGDVLDNLIYARNDGEPTDPIHTGIDFNIIKNIDIGANSVPALGDLDGDGDFDLLLGTDEGTLTHFENTGTPNSPVFELTTNFFDSIDVGATASPELVDWDADGLLDLLVGTGAGYIQYWRNVGSETNFDLVLASPQLADISTVIKVDQWAVPRAVDFDGDGRLDLLVGEIDFNGLANLRLYRNVGTAHAPLLTLITNQLLPTKFRFFTMPSVMDWDGDGRLDILLGGAGPGITWYRNLAAPGSMPSVNTLVAQPAIIPGSDDGSRLALAFADIDDDGDQDIFVGETNGGLNFYRREGAVVPRGDIDGLAGISQGDVSYLINYLLLQGPAPQPTALAGDVNCSGALDIADVVSLISYLYLSGPSPCAN